MTNNEPVVTGGVLGAILQSVLALLLAFGVNLTEGQIGAIEGAFAALTLLVAWLVRQHVTPSAKVAAVFAPPVVAAPATVAPALPAAVPVAPVPPAAPAA